VPLSPRHAELAELIAAGLENADIARHFGVHIRVIEVHIAMVLRMLDLQTRAEIVEWVTNRRRPTV
jgi:DNA-binding CsgD family transcriptional regulator